ncbi:MULTISPECIES: hypothetical protein [unclassified Paenibacillus]|uniref:Uncharacterized protein n=2 Tax=Bacillati TaxID=1783272 RepID=A0ABW3Q7B8_9BACL|nr:MULTISPECIES: hypothetical protein [unclassified Paenibacillus]MCM3130622.1 hypothetical protein [Paenibacillus sp. MER 78]SDX74247.1 hypothetical protein SAMN05518848_11347 [Paenibacillus sp. PDC88]SFS89697.1 hypothetical protein SAMN04488601_106167 [Paenibacillus sp. 453mf]
MVNNLRYIEKNIKNLFRAIIIFPGSLLVGNGIDQVGQWFRLRSLSPMEIIISGFSFILVFYIIPQIINNLMAIKKIRKYYPITNDVISEHREFFMENIDQEITFLQQAADTFIERGMRDDYNLFIENLQTMKEIRSCIIGNQKLESKYLTHLNQVFNRGYLLKKM